MCRLRNIMRDYQESVITGLTDTQTETDAGEVIPMCRYRRRHKKNKTNWEKRGL